MVATPTWQQAAYMALWGPLGHLPSAGAVVSRPGLPSLGVTAGATGSNKVTVAAGVGLIPGPNAATVGGYPWVNGASTDVTIAPVSTGLSRIDLVSVQLTDSATPPNADIVLVSGTAAASPVTPSWPAGCLRLASVRIADTGVITVTPVALKMAPFGAQVVVASLTEVASPYEGLAAYRTTDDTEWTYNGSAWVARRPALPKAGLINATTDSTGYVTWTHNFGAVPSAILIEPVSPITGTFIPSNHITDSYTSSQARTRFLTHTGAVLASQPVSFRYACVA